MQRSSVKEARESLLGAITDVKVLLAAAMSKLCTASEGTASQSYLTAVARDRGEARPV